LEDIRMNKILSVIAMALMIVGLSGCLDDPDKAAQKVSSSIQL